MNLKRGWKLDLGDHRRELSGFENDQTRRGKAGKAARSGRAGSGSGSSSGGSSSKRGPAGLSWKPGPGAKRIGVEEGTIVLASRTHNPRRVPAT